MPVPEWRERIYVRTMSSKERREWEGICLANREKTSEYEWRERFVVLVACDVTGERIFTVDDVAALERKNAKALDRIFEAGMKLNKLSPADIAELKKNSETTPPSASVAS